MVLDAQRNEAYAAAIARAVQRKKEAGCTQLLALDVGAGTGLLSMMAARWVAGQWATRRGLGTCSVLTTALLACLGCMLPHTGHVCTASRKRCMPHPPALAAWASCRSAGADEVVAAEISQHMCDVGEETCIMNGYLGRITLLDRWGGAGRGWEGGGRLEGCTDFRHQVAGILA